ncbi:DUF4837 family protein [Fulvivirga lutea]|uniref:DUF4837 family protein n=1 Tax=Fulvivirga lutea TaxID=2810512 RepID=A0A975A0R9_9BACT|nr:DUF4837 family protein [Fulvivirga lutea]QSE97495.1 DUF4837 family protein [Fulvivirga lutea]
MNLTKALVLTLSIILLSCGDGKKEVALLPKASGKPGEMIVVMDSAQWKGALGDAVKETFQAEVKGLPRQEYLFKLNRVEPTKFNSVLKTVKNLLFVVTLDSKSSASRVVKNYFTKSSLDKIRSNDDLFVFTAEDEFARGQNIMYLFGNSPENLIQKIEENKERLQGYFNNAENERLFKGLYNAEEKEGFTRQLIKDHNCSMRIPFGYKMVVNQKGFIWFRQINDESDKDIFITYKTYNSDKAFTQEAIINFRDSVAQRQLFEDPAEPDTYIKTETQVPYIPVISREYNFNNKFAIETRGLWKTNNLSMGGPFIGYTVVDENLNRLYYIEGFVYSPGKSQREFIRELQVILNTFKVSSELENK